MREYLHEVIKYNQKHFEKYNPETYIRYPLEDYTKAYKYCGNLYTFEDLYEVLKNSKVIDIQRASFIRNWRNMTVVEWYNYQINIVYLAKLNMNNGRTYYIGTDGIFYNGNYEMIPWTMPRCDGIELMDEGVSEVYRAGFFVYKKFIDREYSQDDQYINVKDMDLSNNRVDNVYEWKAAVPKKKNRGEIK